MQGLELERVQELGEPGETRWGRLRGGALQWGSLFPREVAQNRCGLRHTPKGHTSEGPRGAPNTGDPHQAAVHPCDQRQFPHETRSSAQQPPCLPAGTRGLGCSRSPHIYRPSRLPGPRGSCLPSHREVKVKNEKEVAQSCPTLRDPMDCSLAGSSIHGPTLCDSMNCSTPGLPVHHQLPEFTQTHTYC